MVRIIYMTTTQNTTNTRNYRNGRETEKVTTILFHAPISHDGYVAIGVKNNERRYDGEITLNGYWLMLDEKSMVRIGHAEFVALSA